jgi:hypothetical protein
MSNALAKISAARMALATVSTLDDVLQIRDAMEAVRTYIKAAQAGLEAQNLAAEIKLRAERKAGEMLAEMELHGGDRRSKSHDVTLNLADLGISKMQSSRWQLQSKLPEEDYASIVEQCNRSGIELTQAAVLRAARQHVFCNEPEKPKRLNEPNLWDLVSTARESISALRELFGEKHRDALIGVLRDELEILEGVS